MNTRSKANQAELKKVPIFTATKSLDVKYVFNSGEHEKKATAFVPGAPTHAVLYAGYEGLLSTRSSMKTSKGKSIYTASVDDTNFATSAITILYTDTSTEEGYLGEEVLQKTFHVAVENPKDHRILASSDFYTEKKLEEGVTASKAGRDSTFNALLNQRITAFSAVSTSYDLPGGIVATPDALSASIKDPMFHETFNHSEQAEFHYLSSAAGLSFLLKNVLDTKAVYLYGIVLDIFTERMICKNCNGSALGMQSSHQAGFLHDFGQTLLKQKVQPRAETNLMLSVRVSAKQAARQSATMAALRHPQDEKVVHEYNPDKSRPTLLQAENKALGTKQIITAENLTVASYSGAFFLSSQISKDKLEKTIKIVRRPK